MRLKNSSLLLHGNGGGCPPLFLMMLRPYHYGMSGAFFLISGIPSRAHMQPYIRQPRLLDAP